MQYELKIYNKWDNGSSVMQFDDINKLHYWINQCRLSGLHFDVIKLCKRHAEKIKPFHRMYKCDKLILSE